LVRDAIQAATPSILCLQETKLSDINNFKAKTFLPLPLANSFAFNPADGTRGGVRTAWNAALWDVSATLNHQYSITTSFRSTVSDYSITITNIYAPSDHRLSRAFLAELFTISPVISGPWLLIGDFNLVRSPAEKSNGLVNQSLVNAFNDTIQQLAAIEIPLLGRTFTWSNGQPEPTQATLDRAFVNLQHTTTFPNSFLSPLPKPTSDHTPILLSTSSTIPRPKAFWFENAWLHNSSFLPSVLPAWRSAAHLQDAAGRLAACLKSTRAAAKVWSRRIRAPRDLIQNCKFLILLFDTFEDTLNLSAHELQVRRLCQDSLSVANKQRAAYWKQRSKFRAIKEGDANTAFHHAQVLELFQIHSRI